MKTLEELGWRKEKNELSLIRYNNGNTDICFTCNEYTDYKFVAFKRYCGDDCGFFIHTSDIEVIRAMVNKLEELNGEDNDNN